MAGYSGADLGYLLGDAADVGGQAVGAGGGGKVDGVDVWCFVGVGVRIVAGKNTL